MEARDGIVAFYEASMRDQWAWSDELNLHFGYYRRGLSLFDREQLLDEMNSQVSARLGVAAASSSLVLDAGCGAGPTARHVARRFPAVQVLGLTVVGRQRDVGNEAAAKAGLYPRVRIELGDYLATGLETASVDAAYAIESVCYAPGNDKAAFFREMSRVLRPGGRLVVADGFVRHAAALPPVARRLHAAMCSRWALPALGSITLAAQAMRASGFEDVRVEDVSWRVAPSVAHVPVAVARLLLRDRSALRCAKRRANLLAPVAAVLAGAHRAHFGYYFLVGRRAAA